MIRLLAITILCVAGGAAMAQDLRYSDTNTIACLEEAVGIAEQQSCIGASANQCVKTTPGGSSTVAMGGCFDQERAFWDVRLNDVYARLLEQQAERDPVLNERMRAMQRAWIPYRDARCDYEFVQWGGGTGGGPAIVACLMYATAEQVLVLEQNLR